jgi:hypothetical protein
MDAQLVDLDNAWQRIADLQTLADHQERSSQYRVLNRQYHLSHSRNVEFAG